MAEILALALASTGVNIRLLVIAGVVIAVSASPLLIAIISTRAHNRKKPKPAASQHWLSDYLTHLDAPKEQQSAGAEEHSPQVIERMRRRMRKIGARSPRVKSLTAQLAAADIPMSGPEWLITMVVVTAIIATVLSLLLVPAVGIPLALVGVWIISGAYIGRRQTKRQFAFEQQLADTLSMISSAMSAGAGFASAMHAGIIDSQWPMKDELTRYERETSFGVTPDQALDHMLERNPSNDFALVVAAIQVQRTTGGNLAQILDGVANTIRDRNRVKLEVRVLTAQVRTSSYIVTLIPIGLGLFLSQFNPQYFGPMLHDPIGWAILGACGLLITFGALISRKIADIKL